MAIAPLKVSYCTTCKGRLPHLKQTLPANMEAEKGNPNVEFVVLDYGDDGKHGDFGAWIRETFPKELKSGRLRYARYETDHFEMAHAKNMAHRLATGDILCNLDADNYLAPNFSRWLQQRFAEGRHPVVTVQHTSIGQDFSHKLKRLTGRKAPLLRGMGGRVALRCDDFKGLGGYDEHYSAWGDDDVNLVLRARSAGLDIVKLPLEMCGGVIDHGHNERIENLHPRDQAVSMERLSRDRIKMHCHSLRRVISRPAPRANPEGDVGCGAITLNFSEEATVIPPLQQSLWQQPAPGVEPAETVRTDWAEKLTARTHPQITPRAR